MSSPAIINEPVDVHALEQACGGLPLFPLPNVVFIPHSLLPLHVFEPRYRALVRYCLDRHRFMAVPRLLPGWENDYEGRPPVYNTAGVGRIIRHQELADGRFYIVLEGLHRAEIRQETDDSRSFRLAEAQLISLPSARPETLRSTIQRARMMVAQLLSQGIGQDAGLEHLLESDLSADELLDRLAHASIRDPSTRQTYLETARLEQRTEMVTSALANALTSSDALEA